MSLLMKALEKAAKDRVETTDEHAAAATAGTAAAGAGASESGLTLEPMAMQRTAAPTTAPREPTLSPRKPGGPAPAAPSASRESARAATVIRAGRRDGGGGAYFREHPLIVFGTLAALFLIGYGSYVYLQMTNPGLFIKQPPPRPAQAPPLAQAPAPAVSGGTVAQAQPVLATASLLPPLKEAVEKEKPLPQPAASTSNATPPAAAPAAAAPTPAPAPPAAARDTIKITAGSTTPAVNPLLADAYTALKAGDFESSQQFYNRLLKSEPNNIDALLGSAAIAVQHGDSDQAGKYYIKVLELDPRNTLAQAGLIGMFDRADPLAAETRVKQLIARDPSAYLYFTLGNVYVDQNRWPDAQQAYFQAHHLQPDNADYAYNLAVGLEHVGQPKPALNFYRRAVELAAAKGRANFSTAAAQERISKLEKVVQ